MSEQQGAETSSSEAVVEASSENDSSPRKVEVMEIEEASASGPEYPEIARAASADDEDEFDNDLRELLPTANNKPDSSETSKKVCMTCMSCCFTPAEKVGNMTIFLPTFYYTRGWGIRGPHWFGPLCILLILTLATAYLMRSSLPEREYTATTCAAFMAFCTFHLFNSAYRDPGLIRVRISDEEAGRDYCWCDFCSNYQPPGGAHCPECNVCVAGYDHHCVWMGTCIGRNNFRQFIRFNLAWLAYLAYAIVWVKILGPLLLARRNHQSAEGD